MIKNRTATEAAERQVFDHVATTIVRRLPQAQSGKKITLRLLRETLALDPDGLYPCSMSCSTSPKPTERTSSDSKL